MESTLTEPLVAKDDAQRINEFEAALAELPEEMLIKCPLKHTFTPGLYLRQIFMPKDSIIVSRRHLTEHPFIVLTGVADVFDELGGYVDRIEAPYVGITKPGTRRMLHIREDSIWLTAHATDLTDPDEIVATVSEHENPMLPPGFLDHAFENKKELPL